jgi:diaminohydroxyphosphoribosylaminopyrimidine deaminase/5-amino-6-(5-phosphoribosylamino)uracil reductase
LSDGDKVDLAALVSTLGEMECNDVMIEAGACLAGAFLRNDLVDALTIYLAPMIMGTHARGMFHMPGVDALSDSVDLTVIGITRIGDDIRITAELAGKRRN